MSWETNIACFTENDKHGDYSVESLKSKIKNEFSENKQFYSDFNHIREKDIHLYLNDREYNLNVVDVIPYVTANAMNTSLSILQVQNGQVSTLLILPPPPPRNIPPEEVGKTICVCKIGGHYNVI